MMQHTDIFREKDAYSTVANLNLPDVRILNIDVIDTEGNKVPFIDIPRTRLPNLTRIDYTPIEIERRI